MARDVVTVAGALAQRPHRGGHAWVFLQYLLGFVELGYDVHFVDVLPVGGDPDGVAELAAVMDRAGLAERWTVLAGEQAFGAPRSRRSRRRPTANEPWQKSRDARRG